MSRIHDALKRAEQEKAAQQGSGERLSLTPVSHETDGSNLYSKQISVEGHRSVELTRTSRNTDDAVLQYEELMRRCAHPQWKSDSSFRDALAGESGKIVAERFRTLRSRLYQMAGLKPLRRVLVTSSVPSEGKTFVATNLARSIVRQADRRVLLIDADLRAPRLHSALGAPSSPGLSDFLRGESDHYAIVQNGSAPNLCFIACGTRVSNPSELLLNDRMRQLLDTVSPAFDWVILDTPPSLPVHDASNLAGQCDGVLFVVRAGETDSEVAIKGSAEFRNKNLLGVVLNQVEASEAQRGYYYGHSESK